MANLVVAIPGLTPAAYWELTQDETNALIDAVKRSRKG